MDFENWLVHAGQIMRDDFGRELDDTDCDAARLIAMHASGDSPDEAMEALAKEYDLQPVVRHRTLRAA